MNTDDEYTVKIYKALQGVSSLTQDELGRQLEMHVYQVDRLLTELIGMGYVTVEYPTAGNGPTRYKLAK